MGSISGWTGAIVGQRSGISGVPDQPSASQDPLLAVSGVGFQYESTDVLEDIDLAVDRGEFVALVGPSGCGKSTLLNLISGVLAPSAGHIEVAGVNELVSRLGHVSYMQQKDLLLPWRTVSENGRLDFLAAEHADHAFFTRHQTAAVERVDIHAFVARTDGYHEVLAQRNTIDPNACDPGHFDVQDRERDRIAFLAV